jgi:glycosyltransferase involved in cell wall biosynthesis
MHVWLVNPHDAIPGEEWGYRHSIATARALDGAGHKVTWWATNFSHATKRFRSPGWSEIEVSPNFRVVLVPVPAYRRHVGLARLWSLFVYAWRLCVRARSDQPPDVIILTLPLPIGDLLVTRLAHHLGAKLIADFRDLWPELFESAFPAPFRRLARVALQPLFAARSYTLRRVDGLFAVCHSYLDLACKTASHLTANRKRVVYCGVELDRMEKLFSDERVEDLSSEECRGPVRAIYAGTLGANYDIETVLNAARELATRNSLASKRLRIVIAGDGPRRPDVEAAASPDAGALVDYLGVLPFESLCREYRSCEIGIIPYARGSTVAMPLKTFDYLAAGLAIVSSIGGELGELLSGHDVGIRYSAGNAASLADALERLVEDDNVRCGMGRRARALAPSFDRTTQYEQIAGLVDAVAV